MDMLPVDIDDAERWQLGTDVRTGADANTIAEDDAEARPTPGAPRHDEGRSGTPVSVVTGATDGIGRAVALQLAWAGHRVLVVGRDTTRGAMVVREMTAVAARPQ